MTVLVTGATGFIGKHLVEALSATGGEVLCLVRTLASSGAGPGANAPRPNVRQHLTDFSRTDLGISDAVFDRVDAIYHLAGATRAVSEARFREANVTLTGRLLDRAARSGASPRFVYISSQAAAGPAKDESHPLTERDPAAPVEAYGRSKLAAEQLVLARRDMPVTVVRPVAVYGGGDRDFLAIFRMAKRGLAIYPGIRDSVVNTIHVDDLVRGIIAAARSSNAIGKTYFLSHRESASWRSIYKTAAESMGQNRLHEINIPLGAVRLGGAIGDLVGRVTRHTVMLNGSKAALAAPKFWICSTARAAADFGFVSQISLREGMRSTYEWYLRHRWL